MIYLNYTNLDDETQQRLLSMSKEDVKSKYGEDIRAYAERNHLNYENVLFSEATRNLYNYEYVFNI